MTAGSRLERIVAARTAERYRTARSLAGRLVSDLRGRGYDTAVIGSLATGRFRLHSDVDLLVRSAVDPAGRAEVERAVAGVMRGSGIACDLIFACDLSPSQREVFEHDLVIASGLREARTGRDLAVRPPRPKNLCRQFRIAVKPL